MEAPVGRDEVRLTPLWKNRDYLLLWSGQTVSILGSQVTQIAFPLLVLGLTGSPATAGFVAAARTVPYLCFALPAGALVDRWDRKLTMIICGAGSALALASVTIAYLLGVLAIPQIVAVSFIEGAFALIYGLAETSALPRVVPKAQMSVAVAQQQLQYSLGGILGPPLGGALYSASPLLPFALDAASYATASVALTAIRTRFSGERVTDGRSLWAEVSEGVRWLWGTPPHPLHGVPDRDAQLRRVRHHPDRDRAGAETGRLARDDRGDLRRSRGRRRPRRADRPHGAAALLVREGDRRQYLDLRVDPQPLLGRRLADAADRHTSV